MLETSQLNLHFPVPRFVRDGEPIMLGTVSKLFLILLNFYETT